MEQQKPLRYTGADLFTYAAPVLAIAAGAAQSVNIQIDTEADFECSKLTYAADIAGAAQTDSGRVVPLVTVSISEGGASARPLMNTPVPISSLFGDGRIPFILPSPKIFRAGQMLSFSFVNISAGTTYRLYAALIGRKLFLR